MKTVNDLIKELQGLREDLKDKPITVIRSNGLRVYPEIKKKRKKERDMNKEKEENKCSLCEAGIPLTESRTVLHRGRMYRYQSTVHPVIEMSMETLQKRVEESLGK